jgi:hypothetical protein
LDLVTANLGDSSCTVLFNKGNGTFSGHKDFKIFGNVFEAVALDLDGDGFADLVSACDSNVLAVLKNDGSGTFTLGSTYRVGTFFAQSLCGADFDRDGDKDIAVVSWHDNSVFVFRNNGDGSFSDAVIFGTGKGPQSGYSLRC